MGWILTFYLKSLDALAGWIFLENDIAKIKVMRNFKMGRKNVRRLTYKIRELTQATSKRRFSEIRLSFNDLLWKTKRR